MIPLTYKLGAPLGEKATFGLIVLRTDETIEADFRHLIPNEGIALHTTRIPCQTELTPSAIAGMEAALPAAVSLLPHTLDYDVIGYACTSGATIIGPHVVASRIRQAARARHVTDPLTATRAACAALGVRRLAFLTPYIADVSARMRSLLEEDGLTISGFGSFGEESDERIARIDSASIRQAAIQVARLESCDALFLSCTNLRAVCEIEWLEAELDIPVIASSQALAWHMMQLAKLPTSGLPFGALMQAEL
jgi:maleate isomerase